jgi:thiol-disulfide isomerase/thioredoxin
MKRIVYFALATLAIISCKQDPKDYVSFSGKIINQNSDSLIINSKSNRDFKKRISLSEDGSFSDTLKIVNGSYNLYDGTDMTSLYLKNGDNLRLTLNAQKFQETLVYNGKGADVNNYLVQKKLNKVAVIRDKKSFLLSKENYAIKLDTIKSDFLNDLQNVMGLDSAFVVSEQRDVSRLTNYLARIHEQNTYFSTVLAKGKESPKFVRYENNAGGQTSLHDLKGKYVYIDVWATWCGPCIAETPYLKKIEEAYLGKNIEFVSISIDERKEYDKWKSMIKDKELGGIQLLADKAWNSDFILDYKIIGIPRFILIDPKGNIITPKAPRPSEDKLKELFNSLII